jgi:hypothetical protein
VFARHSHEAAAASTNKDTILVTSVHFLLCYRQTIVIINYTPDSVAASPLAFAFTLLWQSV